MTISSSKRASNPSNSTNSEQTRHNSSNYNGKKHNCERIQSKFFVYLTTKKKEFLQKIVRNGQNSRFNEDDPMEEGSRSTVLSFQGNRSHSFISDASLADSEASLTKDFGNLFNSSFANNFNRECLLLNEPLLLYVVLSYCRIFIDERTFEKVSQPKRNESGPLLKRKRNALKVHIYIYILMKTVF